MDDTRQRLLQAATEIFAEKGYDAATVREICGRAQANLALVNYHFGDKMELYSEVLLNAFRPPEGTPKPEMPTDPEEGIRKIIRAMLDKALDQSDQASLRYRLMLHEYAHPSTATPRVVTLTLRPVYDLLRKLVGEVAGLDPDSDQARMCTHSIIGQVIHYTRSGPVVAVLWPDLRMTSEQRDMIAQHIGDMTLRHLRALAASSSGGGSKATGPDTRG
jgi:TetR/AcrR family transcriptional regulator, regulator of cefoperazone and chloramphenicol sensitivity